MATKAQNNIRMTAYYHPKDNASYYLVWDIKTGKSTQYFWGNGNWESMSSNLPASPLAGAKGDVMFAAFYDHNDQKGYYLCWDTKTGKSVQYFWGEGQWEKMQVNLPESPLPGAQGDILMSPYYDSKDGKSYYVVYDSYQGKSIQYYWGDGEWTSMKNNLPEVPVK